MRWRILVERWNAFGARLAVNPPSSAQRQSQVDLRKLAKVVSRAYHVLRTNTTRGHCIQPAASARSKLLFLLESVGTCIGAQNLPALTRRGGSTWIKLRVVEGLRVTKLGRRVTNRGARIIKRCSAYIASLTILLDCSLKPYRAYDRPHREQNFEILQH